MDVMEFEILNTVTEPTELLEPVTTILDSVTYTTSGDPLIIYDNLIRDITTVNGNTRLGAGSMTANISGYASNNFAFGHEALYNTISGTNANTMIGYKAGYSNQTGQFNVGVGSNALYNNLVGNNNVGVGVNALYNTFSSNNIGVGSNVLYSNTTGENNVGIGARALYSNTVGNDNLGVGFESLTNNTDGNDNVSVGYQSLYSNTIGSQNLSVGSESMFSNIGGNMNTSIGKSALYSSDNGNNNVCLGFEAMRNGTPTDCVAVGHSALYNANGGGNIALGYRSLASQDYRNDNIAIGFQAMENSTGFGPSIAIGTQALQNAAISFDENYAIGIGKECLKNFIDGAGTIGIGHNSLQNIIYESGNHAVGYNTLNSLTTGSVNTAFGTNSMVFLQDGTANSAFGTNSNIVGSTTNYTTCIGYDAQPSTDNASNEVTLGNSNVAVLRCQVPLTITSDERDKTEINDLQIGLEFIEKLRPVKFKWDKREWYGSDGKLGVSNGSKKQDKINVGLIAQEVDQNQTENNWEFLQTVFNKNPERLEVTYANIIYPMIKAIQQLSATVKALKTELEELEAAVV